MDVRPTDEGADPDELPQQAAADGGEVESTELSEISDREKTNPPFESVSATTMTKRDRYEHTLNELIIAPAVIVWEDWRARVGALIMIGYVLMGTVGVFLVDLPHPNEGPRYLGPFQEWAFPLGTDKLGQGIFSQIVHATPAMLEMIVAGALFATVVATVVGTLSGYKGGLTDRLLMTFTDVLMTIPGLPLVIVLAVIFEPQRPWVVGIVLTVNAWAGLARAIRSQVLTLRDENFVEASRLMGISTPEILRKDIIPPLMPYVTVNFINSARTVIFASVGLYFLGILPFTGSNWGVMMNSAYTTGGSLQTFRTMHWLLAPMITIIILSFGLILFAQGTDRIFNPRVIARHATPVDVDGDENDEDSSGEIASQIRG